ncbi:MAG: hypothetical protein IT521_05570 [Burkholderiales bacterium]|nr:hypothetical protein [Burkholderiales bacterium]
MSYSRHDPRPRDDIVAVPRVWVTLALSLIVHTLALWLVTPHLPLTRQGGDTQGEAGGQLAIRLMPRREEPRPPPATREAPPLPPPASTPPPRVAVRKRPPPPVQSVPPPPVISATPQAPVTVPPSPPPSLITPVPVPPPIEEDLSSYVEARRRARGETGASATSGMSDAASAAAAETARRDRLVMANLGNLQSSTFGNEAKNGGGTFQIRNMGYDSADFTFFGWSRDIKRRTFQVIEVRKGGNSSINIAIVRKIISIIRDHEQGDFRWESKRLGRDLMLSARPEDNAKLEAFMMEEFFIQARTPR